MDTYKLLSLELQLFAEGGEGGAGEGAGVEAPDAGEQTGVSNGQSQQAGARTPDAGEGTGTVADRKTQFRQLIRGEYKDLFEEEVSGIVRRRLKSTEDSVNRYNEQRPIMETLAAKYGVDAGDVKALAEAIDQDDSYFADAAARMDMTIPQYKNMLRDKRQIADLQERLEAQNTQEEANRILAGWEKQSEGVKQVYPGYDLATELANPAFEKLLNAGVDVRTAYEVVHKDEILPAAMQFAAQKTAAKVANAMRSGASRPAEGALGGSSAVVLKRDVNNMSKEERQELIRRAKRGERIEL